MLTLLVSCNACAGALQTADEVSKLNATDMLPWQIKAFKEILELFAPAAADEDSSDNEAAADINNADGKQFVDDDAINLKKPGNVRMDDWTKFINKLVTDFWLRVSAALYYYNC